MNLLEDELTDKKNFSQNLAGYSNQLKLLLLFLWRGLDRKYNYKIGTEFKPAEKFDDLVFFSLTENGQQASAICLQAKHTRNEAAILQYDHFVSDDNNTAICNLRKYFISFRKILQQNHFFPNEYILCSNYYMPNSKMLENVKNAADFICFKSGNDDCNSVIKDMFSDSSGIWECHKLDTLSDNVESMLHNLSNLRILGQELINSVIDCEKKGLKHVTLDLRKYWISLYYRAFFNDNVITKNEFVIFKKQFIDLNHQIEEEPFRHIFFDEYSKKADWNYIKNVRFNATFVNALKQTQEKQTSNSKNDQIEDSIDLCIEETKAANSEDDEYQKLAKALVNQALNPFNSTVDPIILKNIETIKKIVECVEQLTFSDDFLGNPQNKFLQIVLEKYTLSETFKKETTNILFENESNYVMDNHSEKMSERESDDMAQELAHCFLLKQKISNSVSTKCGRFLKVIDNGMKLIFNLRPNEKEIVFCNKFLTSYARERLKHMEIKFTNPKVDEVIKEVIKVFLNSSSKLDVKKFETDRTYGELEMLIEELFDINVENNYIQLKELYFENNVPLSKNAKKFRDKLEKRRSDLQRSWIKYYKIKITTWDDLFLEHKDWVTKKITLLAGEIKYLLENRIEGQNFLTYDKEECIKNGTQGLLQDLFGEHIKEREYDAQKLADKTQRIGSREDWLILTTDFFDKITASEKAEIFKYEFINFDMKKFYGTITIKSLFNKANPNDKDLQRLRQDLSAEILDLIKTKQNNNDRLIIYNRFNFQENGTAGFLEHLIGSVFEENRNILTFKREGDMFVTVLLQAYSNEIFQKFKDRKIELTKTLYDFNELAEELGSSINVNDSQCTVLKYSGTNSNAMKALSESVFVSTNIPNEIKFNSHFLECEKWSKEAHEFRQILEDKLSFRAFKSLEEKQFLINISFDDKGKKFRNPIEIATTMANEILKLFMKNPTEDILHINIDIFDEKSGQNLSSSSTQFMPKSSTTAVISKPLETIKSIMDCIFDENETLGMKKMRKIFFKYDNWSNSIETFREKLRNQLKSTDLSALKNLVIETQNFPFCCDRLIESGDITNEVQEFKKKLLIVTSPGEERLSEIISKEIDDELNLTNDDSASKLLLIKVINWAKEKEGRLLTKEDMIKFMGEIKGKMNSIMAAGFLYRGKLRKYNISFNNINIDIAIKAYLQSDGKILILESNFIQLTAIKTDKVLRKEPKCHGINSLIFHKLSQLPLLDTYEIKGKILNIISSAFSSDQRSNLLVVVDDSSKSNVLKNFMFLNSLLNSALKKQNKKFIFITDSCSDFTELLRNDNFYSEFNIEKQVDHIRFSDLTEDSQAILIRQDVTFKGLKICTSSKSKEYDPEIYIERLVGSINIDHKFFEKCNELNKNDLNSFHHIFIFYEIRENDLEKILKSYGIEPNKREKFTYLSMEELKSPYVCESHITYETLKEMYLQHTVHRITIIEETVEKANNVIYQAYVSEEYFLHYVSHNKIVYINDSAGMGKSTILSSFEEKIKRTKMLKWIIRLNMNDCAKELRNARISNIDQEFGFHCRWFHDIYLFL